MGTFQSRRNCHKLVNSFVPMVKMLTEFLGPDYEIVLHDVSTTKHRIAAIANGHITGRDIDSPLTKFGSQILSLEKFKELEYISNYPSSTSDGKQLRSGVAIIRDETKNEVVGILCINYDFLKAKIIFDFADSLLSFKNFEDESPSEIFDTDVKAILDKSLREIRNVSGKVVNNFNKHQIISLVKVLRDANYFKLKGSVLELAKQLHKSKYTIYRYIREVKQIDSTN